jgi:hypothetical protein
MMYMYLQQAKSGTFFFKLVFCWRLECRDENSQKHGSADQDPDLDPHQNVMDPKHWPGQWRNPLTYEEGLLLD